MTAHRDDTKVRNRALTVVTETDKELIVCDERLNATIHEVKDKKGFELGWVVIHHGRYGSVWTHIPEPMARTLISNGSRHGDTLDVRMLVDLATKH